MAIVSISGTDVEAVVNDALGIIPEPKEEPKVEAKAEPKVEAKEAPKDDPADDVEGDDGLTPREKRDLSAKMLKAVGKRVRERKEAEEFAAAQYAEKKLAERKAQELEQELSKIRQASQPKQETGKPKREDFASDTEFLDAMIAHGVEEGMKRKAQEDAKAAQERRQAEILEAAKSRIQKALEVVPDFKEVTESADVDVPPAIAGYMQKSEMFAELGYHLAKNPEILVSLGKLAPDEQLVKIGKIEATLKPFGVAASDDGPKPTKQDAATKAPSDTGSTPSKARSTAPVITPLNGANGAQVEKDPSEMNTREMISDWARKNKANFSLRKRH